MSGRYPVVTGLELVAALEKFGYVSRRQKGSHLHMYREADGRRVTIPVHKGKDLPVGTLRGIMKDANVLPEELKQVL